LALTEATLAKRFCLSAQNNNNIAHQVVTWRAAKIIETPRRRRPMFVVDQGDAFFCLFRDRPQCKAGNNKKASIR